MKEPESLSEWILKDELWDLQADVEHTAKDEPYRRDRSLYVWDEL